MTGYFHALASRRGLVLALAAPARARQPPQPARPVDRRGAGHLAQAGDGAHPGKGLGPLEVERLVTFPIENAMAGVPGTRSIRSTSRFGLSAVYVTFADEVSVDTTRELVGERLNTAEANMAPGVGSPQMGPAATGLGEVCQFRVVGSGYTPMQLRRILQWQVAPQLKLVPGVTDVDIYGGQLEIFEVRIQADALRRYGLTLSQVSAL